MYSFLDEVELLSSFVKGICTKEVRERFLKVLELSKALYAFGTSSCSLCKYVSLDPLCEPCCNCTMLVVSGDRHIEDGYIKLENNFVFEDEIRALNFK